MIECFSAGYVAGIFTSIIIALIIGSTKEESDD